MELQTLIARWSGKLPPGFVPQAGQGRRPKLSGPGSPLQKGVSGHGTGTRDLQRLHDALDHGVVAWVAAARRRADRAMTAEPGPVAGGARDPHRSASFGDEAAFGPAMTAMGAVTSAWSVLRPFGS